MTPLADALDPERFGGKAASLARALRAGLAVPPGYALAWDEEPGSVSGDSALAVRSSAIGEDGAGTSFAGQHLTLLGVRPEDLAVAVLRVRASAAAPSAVGYRAKLGIEGPIRAGVVIQRMVDAAVAGVLFTRDPVSGADVLCVEAAWGLGESVVQGLVAPDAWRLWPDGSIADARPGLKDAAIRLAPGGTVTVPVEDPDTPCLTSEQLARLAGLAAACLRVWGGPLDLEWAFDEGGALWLLQARPVTR